MKYFELRSGNKMPAVGLGLWQIPKEICADIVYEAIKAGYSCFDGACNYGNEKEAGLGIRRAIDEGLVTRDDLFITTKLWNTYHRIEYVEMACRKSMDDLGVEYLDLYLIHWPISLPFVPIEERYPPGWINYDPQLNEGQPRMILDNGVTYRQTWQAMEGLVTKGLVRDIGCSNIDCLMIQQVMCSA